MRSTTPDPSGSKALGFESWLHQLWVPGGSQSHPEVRLRIALTRPGVPCVSWLVKMWAPFMKRKHWAFLPLCLPNRWANKACALSPNWPEGWVACWSVEHHAFWYRDVVSRDRTWQEPPRGSDSWCVQFDKGEDRFFFFHDELAQVHNLTKLLHYFTR